jgi:hypothetical protein
LPRFEKIVQARNSNKNNTTTSCFCPTNL